MNTPETIRTNPKIPPIRQLGTRNRWKKVTRARRPTPTSKSADKKANTSMPSKGNGVLMEIPFHHIVEMLTTESVRKRGVLVEIMACETLIH